MSRPQRHTVHSGSLAGTKEDTACAPTKMDKTKINCLCTDHACPLHPTNHDQGCTPCVRKNQARGEIPSCFFKLAAPDVKPEAYYFQNFADAVNEQSAGKD